MTENTEICIWKDSKECIDCKLKERLICHFQRKYLFSFIGLFFIFVITAFIGVIIAGFGWFLLGWVGFWFFFFEFWEIRILCSHCPFYAEEGRTLHCIANYSSLKIWKYRPQPMNLSEKIQLIIGFMILVGYPLIFLILGSQFLILIICIMEIIIFFGFLVLRRCNKCVNFSCPFNRVDKECVDIFLENNPRMRKAWEESGYKKFNKT
ncbi:MAG: hypothetical protein ACFE9S_17645 [Candidatus Hermodarchaeota archaeon]